MKQSDLHMYCLSKKGDPGPIAATLFDPCRVFAPRKYKRRRHVLAQDRPRA
jgi:hypothetical protein